MKPIRIPPENREPQIKALGQFLRDALPGKPLVVRVEKYKRPRTLPQNNALWGVAYPPIVEHTGYEASELHDVFCEEYFGRVEYEVMGHVRVKPRRTTTKDENGKRSELSTEEFSEFYSFIQRQAAQHWGVMVPDPER